MCFGSKLAFLSKNLHLLVILNDVNFLYSTLIEVFL